jgi:hypothetical protein
VAVNAELIVSAFYLGFFIGGGMGLFLVALTYAFWSAVYKTSEFISESRAKDIERMAERIQDLESKLYNDEGEEWKR